MVSCFTFRSKIRSERILVKTVKSVPFFDPLAHSVGLRPTFLAHRHTVVPVPLAEEMTLALLHGLCSWATDQSVSELSVE